MPILGAMLTVAVLVGAALLIRRLRRLLRYLDADRHVRQLLQLSAAPPAPTRRMAVVTSIKAHRKFRFRPYRYCAVAAAALVGMLATAAAFVMVADPAAPAVGEPAPVTVVSTVPMPTTVSEDRPRATITRSREGTVSVVRPPTMSMSSAPGSPTVTAVAVTRSDTAAQHTEAPRTSTVEAAPSTAAGPSTVPLPTQSVTAAVEHP